MLTEQIESLAAIHCRKGTGDPAVGRDDVYQEIAVSLLVRQPENFKHGWIQAKSRRRDVAVSAQCRHRRNACPLPRYELPARDPGPCDEAAERELRQLVSERRSLSRFQARVVELMLDGLTPAEVAQSTGAHPGSVQAAISTAVNNLRGLMGLEPLSSVRLGRCRAADAQKPRAADRECIECGRSFPAKRVDAVLCSNACRCRARYRKRKSVN